MFATGAMTTRTMGSACEGEATEKQQENNDMTHPSPREVVHHHQIALKGVTRGNPHLSWVAGETTFILAHRQTDRLRRSHHSEGRLLPGSSE